MSKYNNAIAVNATLRKELNERRAEEAKEILNIPSITNTDTHYVRRRVVEMNCVQNMLQVVNFCSTVHPRGLYVERKGVKGRVV